MEIKLMTQKGRKTPRPQNLTIYLGKEDKSAPRIEALDQIAQEFSVNRSQLITMIADGELKVVRPNNS